MRKRRPIEVFSISFLDILSGALGAVIILYVAIPKSKVINPTIPAKDDVQVVLMNEVSHKQEEINSLKLELAKTKKQLEETIKSKTAQPDKDLDIGFKFKGKNVLFIIDTSLSMVEEDRMGQVKAGLKMFLSSLSQNYKIEVIRYPLAERAPFKTMWGTMRELNSENKSEVFDFVYSLKPFGGTPTRDVLLFALKNYHEATDIVLLTDGAPTLHNSNTQDNIYEIIEDVREENGDKRVRISAIGVGSDLIKDKTSDRYKFLSILTQENDGFFVGF